MYLDGKVRGCIEARAAELAVANSRVHVSEVERSSVYLRDQPQHGSAAQHADVQVAAVKAEIARPLRLSRCQAYGPHMRVEAERHTGGRLSRVAP